MDGLDDQSDADNQKIRKVRTNKWSCPVPRGRGLDSLSKIVTEAESLRRLNLALVVHTYQRENQFVCRSFDPLHSTGGLHLLLHQPKQNPKFSLWSKKDRQTDRQILLSAFSYEMSQNNWGFSCVWVSVKSAHFIPQTCRTGLSLPLSLLAEFFAALNVCRVCLPICLDIRRNLKQYPAWQPRRVYVLDHTTKGLGYRKKWKNPRGFTFRISRGRGRKRKGRESSWME